MKRMFVFLLASLMLAGLCCTGFAAAPPQSRITAEVFYSFDDKDAWRTGQPFCHGSDQPHAAEAECGNERDQMGSEVSVCVSERAEEQQSLTDTVFQPVFETEKFAEKSAADE